MRLCKVVGSISESSLPNNIGGVMQPATAKYFEVKKFLAASSILDILRLLAEEWWLENSRRISMYWNKIGWDGKSMLRYTVIEGVGALV